MKRLLQLFAPHCRVRSTITELEDLLLDEAHWRKAHDVFDRIRDKRLAASREANEKLEAQYFFEESCAQTLFNLTETDTPFDAESPYYVVPSALALARLLGMRETEVIDVVVG
jgi:hypothetical protein